MNWNWCKRVREHVETEGEHAREVAEVNLERTKAETAVYEELSKSLRKMRQENHFADGILETFTRGDRK